MKRGKILKRISNMLLLAGIVAVAVGANGWKLIVLIGSGIILSALGTIPEHNQC